MESRLTNEAFEKDMEELLDEAALDEQVSLVQDLDEENPRAVAEQLTQLVQHVTHAAPCVFAMMKKDVV